MKETKECLICGSGDIRHFLTCKDHTVSKKNFEIKRCNKCGFRFTSPRPYDEDLGAYYKAEGYVSHTDTKKGLINTLYHWVRSYTLIKKLQLLMHYTGLKQGRILDYGAGTGAFLDTCKRNGWSATGIEPDADARKVMAEKFGISPYPFLSDARVHNELRDFDAVTAWHVLEHVPNIKETVSELRDALKQKGKLIVAVPNPDSFDAKYYGAYWAAYDVPRHLWHFAPRDIEALMAGLGFRLLKTLPMVFDSYYVSLLSRAHQTGRSGLLNAFWTGLRSNIKANKTGREFSSQIYIFQKT